MTEPKLEILVVEDEEPIRRGLCDVLAYHGYAPTGVADGDAGLSEGLSNRYALVVLDIMLPVLNGFDVCRGLRERHTHLPILLLTALVMMVFDYARIAAILEEQPGTLRALGRGLRFVFRHPVSVLALAVMVGLCVIGLVALRTVLAPGVGEATALGIALVFLLGQLFVAARLALRLTLVGAELALYRGLR